MSLAINIRFIFTIALTFLVSSVNALATSTQPSNRLPEVIKVNGIRSNVEIIRDSYGVPHIRATNEMDTHFGLGFVHAQDRLWQLEFQRRLGSGQLAEILGEKLIPTDKLFRTLNLKRSASAAWTNFSPQEREPIEAYVAGVNSFITLYLGKQLPLEFQILGVSPGLWTPVDVVVWNKVLAWGVSSNWDKELLRVRIASKIGAEKAAKMMPSYLDDGPTILPSSVDTEHARRSSKAKSELASLKIDTSVVDGLLNLNRKVEQLTGLGVDGFGSNSWVLSGDRTTTGQALLANDPHLTAQVPAVWYVAHLSSTFNVTGATIPGAPGVIIGHNDNIAFGITTMNVDSQDIYLEHINEKNEAEFNGAWEPVVIVPHTIKVKGQADVNIKVRITRHGPVISDIVNPTGPPMALRWTASDPEDNGILASLGYNRARNWNEFLEASRTNRPADQNYVFADRRGNIGYIGAATIPVRPDGVDGRLPVPGWDGNHEWRGYLPFERLPKLFNPPSGYIVTANNKVGDEYPLIGTNFAAPYRAARVHEMIGKKRRHSPDDMAQMQGDVLALHARELLPFMLRSLPANARSQQAVEMLRTWDTRVTADSAAAAVFEAWYHALGERLFADELFDGVTGDALWRSYSENLYFVAMATEAALEENSTLCDDVGTPFVESCLQTVASSLTVGLARMSGVQGTDDLNAWRWDRAHHALFPHNPFDANPQLKPIFSRSIPNGGDKFTVNVASAARWDEYNQLHSAQYRLIADLGDLNNSRFIVAPGQSGDPNGAHYDDLLERWQRVEYLRSNFSPTVVDGSGKERLVLKP